MRTSYTRVGWLAFMLLAPPGGTPPEARENRPTAAPTEPANPAPPARTALAPRTARSPASPPGGGAPPPAPAKPASPAATAGDRSAPTPPLDTALLGQSVSEALAKRTAPQFSAIHRSLIALLVLTLFNLALAVFLLVWSRRAASPRSPRSTGPLTTLASRPRSVEERLAALEAAPTPRLLVDELTRRLDAQPEQIRTGLEPRLDDLTSRLAALERNPAPPDSPHPPASPMTHEVAALRQRVDLLASLVPRVPLAAPSCLPLEHEVLRETWKKFQRENREVLSSLEAAQRDEPWLAIRDPLLVQLPEYVPESLRPTFDAVMTAPRDFQHLVTKLTVVERLARGELGALPEMALELTRLRELVHLLMILQSSKLLEDRLNFRLETWITDHFLGFADLYLQGAQQSSADPRQSERDRLAPGLRIVQQVLKVADFEPVELTLGVTPFDSSRHVGRSTASDARLADGIIVGVIRNGFLRGQRVVRQPEVIVNRLG